MVVIPEERERMVSELDRPRAFQSSPPTKERAPRNRTISLTNNDKQECHSKLLRLREKSPLELIANTTINQDINEIIDYLPESFVDLMFLDPPYNITKSFSGLTFKQMSVANYAQWIDSWLPKLIKVLKPNASIYICGDWQSSAAIHLIADKYFYVRNRITWEREKGRGAESNWKNSSEDIFFCTLSPRYTFNVDAVKLKRRVLAPYTHSNGEPKDWERTECGNFRITYPSNIWGDITVPYWSMPENTDHPTQKPEKLLAKIILASSNGNDVIFDPFLGSGTTSVVAKKLGRRYVGVELNYDFCCLAEKRLKMAENDTTIQGYKEGVFWERNTLALQNHCKPTQSQLI